jgi:hypothetical protein
MQIGYLSNLDGGCFCVEGGGVQVRRCIKRGGGGKLQLQLGELQLQLGELQLQLGKLLI